ncbi:hypothetical protein [Anaerosporobacter sp.]|nr:hypothetical protein [Anaerosporobacter sp.]
MMLVGTGDSPWILQFYQKNGFGISQGLRISPDELEATYINKHEANMKRW